MLALLLRLCPRPFFPRLLKKTAERQWCGKKPAESTLNPQSVTELKAVQPWCQVTRECTHWQQEVWSWWAQPCHRRWTTRCNGVSKCSACCGSLGALAAGSGDFGSLHGATVDAPRLGQGWTTLSHYTTLPSTTYCKNLEKTLRICFNWIVPIVCYEVAVFAPNKLSMLWSHLDGWPYTVTVPW